LSNAKQSGRQGLRGWNARRKSSKKAWRFHRRLFIDLEFCWFLWLYTPFSTSKGRIWRKEWFLNVSKSNNYR
jgi:hypothetical protein